MAKEAGVTKVSGAKQFRENEKKWGAKLMGAGWTAIPSVILKGQKALGLNSVDLVILLQIAKHWWKADDLPYPGKASIAGCMGLDARYVRRRLKAMEKAKLITRHRRKRGDGADMTTAYEFTGLIAKATALAEQELEEIDKRKKRRKARLQARPGFLRAVS